MKSFLLILASVASMAYGVPSHTIIVDLEVEDWYPTNNASSVCPNGKTTCAKDSTCCEMKNGAYGCCHIENAVCCPDKLSCCPMGSTCNMKTKSCDLKIKERFYVVEENPSQLVPVEVNPGCPNPSPCLNYQTCCTLNNHEIGCCPYKNGVCCPDGDYCCPAKTTCNAQSTRCDYSNRTDDTYWFEAAPAKAHLPHLKEACPNPEYSCDIGTTCCQLKGGSYGCCPYEGATCCADGEHCCPQGLKCDIAGGRCVENVNQTLVVEESELESGNICDDPKVECPAGTTCCKLKGGNYGCCPYDNAVCCADGAHCCPSGLACDLQHGRCVPHEFEPFFPMFLTGNGFFEMTPKKTTQSPWFADIIKDATICDDPSERCEPGNTCCKLASGGYGCCPYNNGVCCQDGAHCCPFGLTCDLEHGRCARKNFFTVFSPKYAGIGDEDWSELKKLLGDHIMCPNPEDQCLKGQTCCQIADFEYGCCHFSNAVCCSDRMHCCPENTSCDLKKNACTPQNNTVAALTAPSLILRMPRACPSGYFECGVGCCKNGLACCEQFNKCCPLEDMICCDDGKSCCPSNMVCNVDQLQPSNVTMMEVCLLP